MDRSVNIIVPANDNPYGTVYFQQPVYRVQEPLEGVYTANITVRRRYLARFLLTEQFIFRYWSTLGFFITFFFNIAAEVTLDA